MPEEPRASRRGSARGRAVRLRPRRIAAIAFVLFFLQSAIWSVAVPLGSGQDEPAQTITAAADVRGQLIKPHATAYADIVGMFQVRVPGTYANGFPQIGLGLDPACRLPGYGTACHPSVADATVRDTWTYTGGYPPLYYWAVGWPSLLTTSLVGIYLMRLASALLCAAVLACAVLALARLRRPLVPVVAAIAVSPMVLYTAATVQPSGLEITASILLWAAGAGIVFGPTEPDRTLVRLAALGAVLLALARPVSLAYLAAVLLVLAVAAPPAVRRSVVRNSGVRRNAAVIGVAAVLAVVWFVVADPLAGLWRGPNIWAYPGSTLVHDVLQTLSQSGVYELQSIGTFDWAVIPAPRFTEVLWVVGFVAVVLVAGRAVERRRAFTAAALLGCIVVAVPPAFVASSVIQGTSLLLFQGRYVLALVAGIPVLLGSAVRSSTPGIRRGATVLVVLCALAQLDCFYSVLRVYTVGAHGALDLLGGGPGSWRPPISAPLLVASFAAVAALYAALLCGWTLVADDRPGALGERP